MALLRRGTFQLIPLAQQWAAAAAACTSLAATAPQAAMKQPSIVVAAQAFVQRLASHHTASPSGQQHVQAGADCQPGCTDPHHHHEQHGQQQQQKRGPLSFEEQEHTCWSCHDRFQRGGLVCRSCDRIQPADSSLTYFELIGLHQPMFDLDPAALEKRYKLLQWQLHPDKSVTKTAEERQYSAEQAALINQAYGVLRNPLTRANYMLMLGGMAPEEFEGTIADPELVMEVMEAREEVEQEEDQQRLVQLHAANKQRQVTLCKQLSQAFKRGDMDSARQLVAQLSYWARLEEAICQKL